MKNVFLYSFCLISVHASTTLEQEIIHGYIDRMEPAIILLDAFDEEIIVEDKDMPSASREGKWVDIVRNHHTYKIIRVNEKVTNKKARKINRIKEKR